MEKMFYIIMWSMFMILSLNIFAQDSNGKEKIELEVIYDEDEKDFVFKIHNKSDKVFVTSRFLGAFNRIRIINCYEEGKDFYEADYKNIRIAPGETYIWKPKLKRLIKNRSKLVCGNKEEVRFVWRIFNKNEKNPNGKITKIEDYQEYRSEDITIKL